MVTTFKQDASSETINYGDYVGMFIEDKLQLVAIVTDIKSDGIIAISLYDEYHGVPQGALIYLCELEVLRKISPLLFIDHSEAKEILL